MKYISLFSVFIITLDTFKIAMLFFRKNINIYRIILEFLVLFIMIILCIYDMNIRSTGIYLYILLVLSIVTFISCLYEFIKKNNNISTLSIKHALDRSTSGVMFLNKKGNIILINNCMIDILSFYNINCSYISNLKKHTFKENLIKVRDRVYEIKTNNMEVLLTDVTDVYNLWVENTLQNKKIEEYNIKLIENLDNIEKIEKEKNLINIKNKYHDVLGHRLSLLNSYLRDKKDSYNTMDIKFIFDNLLVIEDNKDVDKSLLNLIHMYKLFDVNIDLIGKMPRLQNYKTIFYEIIREAITNAVIHADAKNITIVIKNSLEVIDMTITNDGIKPCKVIKFNEGINGMKRKLSEVGGTLNIDTDSCFVLNVKVKLK